MRRSLHTIKKNSPLSPQLEKAHATAMKTHCRQNEIKRKRNEHPSDHSRQRMGLGEVMQWGKIKKELLFIVLRTQDFQRRNMWFLLVEDGESRAGGIPRIQTMKDPECLPAELVFVLQTTEKVTSCLWHIWVLHQHVLLLAKHIAPHLLNFKSKSCS